MRKVKFSVANTLDHFIARGDHTVDWILWADEAKGLMEDFWKGIDTIVMGRKTYEIALNQTSGSGSPYPGVQTFVMSRSLQADPDRDQGAEIVSDDVVEFVSRLREQDGNDIFLMGGGELAKPVLEAGLVDELALTIHPLLLGSGIPLFHGFQRQIDLELLDCQRFSNGCVHVHYRILR